MPSTHTFHPTILREYDIRGIVGETLFAADARAVGRCFGTVVRRKNPGKSRLTVAVGWDGRLSSPELAEALVEGLTSAGVDVIRIGRGPTPMLYYAVCEHDLAGGIMITGSHNPPTHNGLKMMIGRKPFFGDDIRAFGPQAAKGDVESGQGAATDRAVFDAYVKRVVADFKGTRALTAVWDPGNGANAETVKAAVARLPGKHTVINDTIDGTFPNHHPDPTVPKNLVQLQAEVARLKADVGFAFDGDGDRIGVIDGQGRILLGDQIMQILAESVLKTHPGAMLIADVKASRAFFDEVARMGGKPMMWKTGHSLIKNRMAEVKSPLAGEMSGHIFFSDTWYGFDDALYVAVRFLDIMARDPAFDLGQRFDAMPKMINTPELRFPCADERKFTVIDEVKARLAKSGADVVDIDGVRVNVPGGWWLLRASNTQAVLVARAEADSDANLEKLKSELAGQLRQSGLELPEDASAGH
ncbi:MAG: phosphomannomutase/phosphoglucomutase [Alphaproteobacteria bacterium]|nr:phosphomannomutase/phosphoglucomutase [Alphaproteobacteria bacterium]